jgi:hypothetical protein
MKVKRLLCVFVLSRPEAARIIYRIMYLLVSDHTFTPLGAGLHLSLTRSPNAKAVAVRTAILWLFYGSRCGLTESLIQKPERGAQQCQQMAIARVC